jgi:regulator of protease activity HflC (stomatin/prohibitin superfamily)
MGRFTWRVSVSDDDGVSDIYLNESHRIRCYVCIVNYVITAVCDVMFNDHDVMTNVLYKVKHICINCDQNMFTEISLALSIISLFALIFTLTALWRSCIIVQSGTQVIVERLGKFYKILDPGFHVLIPFADRPRYVRWTYQEERRLANGKTEIVDVAKEIYAIPAGEQMIDFDKIDVLSKDRLSIIVNCVAWFKVHNVMSAVYNIQNLTQSLQTRLFTQIRDVLSRSTLEEAIEGRRLFQREVMDTINTEITEKWGVQLTQFEIQDIDTSKDIREANTKAVAQRKNAEIKQMQIEVDRKTKIAEAETAYKLEEMELRRKKNIKDAEIDLLTTENNAKLERERAIHDSELQKKINKESADLKVLETKRRTELELERQTKIQELEAYEAHKRAELTLADQESREKIDRLRMQNEKEHQAALENAIAQGELVKKQIEAGLTPEYFVMAKYSENIRAMLTNAQKIVVPENIANYLAPASMINNFKNMLQTP